MKRIRIEHENENPTKFCKRTKQMKRIHCPHCDKYLTMKTYKRHYNLHYIPETDTWILDTQAQNNSDKLSFI